MGFFGLSRIVQSRPCQSKYDGLAGRINRCPPDQDPMIPDAPEKGVYGAKIRYLAISFLEGYRTAPCSQCRNESLPGSLVCDRRNNPCRFSPVSE